jgi:hypothetical protein
LGVSNPHRLEVLPSGIKFSILVSKSRNEKNESRTVFENLKAAFSEHLTHTRFISRKLGFSNSPSRSRPVEASDLETWRGEDGDLVAPGQL